MTENQRKLYSKMELHQKSAFASKHGFKAVGRMANRTWNLARKCPMFTKKAIDKKTGKKATVRTKRLINNHAYKIMASGAAQYAHSILQREAKAFRMQYTPEARQAPFLPSINPGAILLLEQFMCAYAQDATRNAVSIRDGLKTHKRLNASLMSMGFEQTNERVFQSRTPSARMLMVCKPAKKVVGKNGKKQEEEDGDSKAPEE